MSEPIEPRPSKATQPKRERIDVIDLIAFLAVLAFVAGLVLLIDRGGEAPARLVLAGATGLVGACVAAWRRPRRSELRRWRNRQAVYRGRRVTFMSTWGTETQPPLALPPGALNCEENQRM